MTDRSSRPSNARPDQRRRRAGRRETARPVVRETTALERWRGPLIGILGIDVLALVGAFLFLGATQKAYACSQLSTAAPSATPAPDGSAAPLGQAQEDMGRKHIEQGASARYAHCPPASGSHYNAPGGPIANRFYGKDDATVPQGWIHNLEHGGLVVLYRCPDGSCDGPTQQQLQQFVRDFPPSPVCQLPAGTTAPVVTRFDDMSTPFAAVLWDRILLLDTLDTNEILRFYQSEGERTNPEPQCPAPSPSAAPAASPEPSASPSPSPS